MTPALIISIVIAVALFGYLLGGVPFGAIIARRHGVDIAASGSGATGATNVFRTLGWRAALPVALLDIAKGVLPALAARVAAYYAGWTLDMSDMAVVVAGVAAMLGHMYSPYFKLRGGKGIATGGGAVIVLVPLAFVPLILFFIALVYFTRIVSVSSLTVAAVLPFAAWLLYPGRPVILGFTLVAVPLVFWAHRANIARLMRGEEPRTTMGAAKPANGGRADDDGTGDA